MVAFSPDSLLVATGSEDRTVRVWSAATGALIFSLEHSEAVCALVFSPSFLFTGSNDGNIKQFSLQGEKVRSLSGHSSEIAAISASADGETIASGSSEGTLVVHSAADGAVLKKTETGSRIYSIAYSMDGLRLAVGLDSSCTVYNAKELTELKEIQHPNSVMTVQFTTDNGMVAGCYDNVIRTFDAAYQLVED